MLSNFRKVPSCISFTIWIKKRSSKEVLLLSTSIGYILHKVILLLLPSATCVCVSQHALGQTPPPVQCMLGYTPWADTHPLGGHPPGQKTPWSDNPPIRQPPGQTPPIRHPPPGQTSPPGQTPPAPNGHCSGRYASYWMYSCYVEESTVTNREIRTENIENIWIEQSNIAQDVLFISILKMFIYHLIYVHLHNTYFMFWFVYYFIPKRQHLILQQKIPLQFASLLQFVSHGLGPPASTCWE